MIRKLMFATLIVLTLAACNSAAPSTPTPIPPATGAQVIPPTELLPTATTAASGDDVRVYGILPDETTAWYEVSEVFINEGNQLNLAVGKTHTVSGDITLNFTHPEQSAVGLITVDISALTSDSRRRDDRIRNEWLESLKFPSATFAGTAVKGLPTAYQEGTEITFEVTGDLQIRDVVRPTTFAVKARLENEQLSGRAETKILMTDFGFDPPDIAGILKAENEARVALKFVAAPTQ